MAIFKFPCSTFRRFNIPLLGLFRTHAQQDDHLCSPLDKIEPVPWAAINPRFPNALSHGFDIAQIAEPEPVQSHDDPRTRVVVFQLFQPIRKLGRLPDDHGVNLR